MKNSFLLAAAVAFSFVSNAQNGLDFDGMNDHVQTTINPISGTNARTLEAWIKINANTSPSSGGRQHIICDMGVNSPGQRYSMNVLNKTLRIEINGSGINGSTVVDNGVWHHVAVVYDPSSGSNIKLYVDGAPDGSGSLSVNTASTGNVRLGRRLDNVNNFDGTIDEFRMWNIARTDAEILSNYNKELCSIDPDLHAYINFNQGTASGNNAGLNKAHEAVTGSHGVLNGFSFTGGSSNWVSGATLTAGLSVDAYDETVCDSLLSPFGNTYWTTDGKHIDTATNNVGCGF